MEFAGRARIDAFLELVASAEAHRLAPVLLAAPERGSGGRSTLNNDGMPVQLCVSAAPGRRSWRLIADPASTVGDPGERLASGRAALAALLEARAPLLGPLCQRTLSATLPDERGLATLRSGAMWLAAELGGPGLALYTTASWGDDEARWARALSWLAGVLPDDRCARRVLAQLGAVARPVAHAIEGDAPSRARAKLYLRARAPVPLARLGLDLLVDPRAVALIGRLFRDVPLRRDSLVYSVGFGIDDGELRDAKIDACAHCVGLAPREWVDVLGWWAGQHGLERLDTDLAAAVVDGPAELAFVGLGLRADGEMRTNLYLKPVS